MADNGVQCSMSRSGNVWDNAAMESFSSTLEELVDVATSSEDAEHSKPAPDIFQVALRKLGIAGHEAIAIGDTPYDAQAAGKAGISTIGMLCGGFTEADLRAAGCAAVYPGPGALLCCFETPLLGTR